MWHPEHLYDGAGHLDEGVIHAWLDGALDRDAAREVEAHSTACTTCSARVEEARGFVAGASRILGALDEAPRIVTPPAVVPPDAPPLAPSGPVRPAAAARGSSPMGDLPARRRSSSTRRLSLAAAAVFLVAAGSLVLRDRFGGTDGVRDAIVAERQPTTMGEGGVESAGAATSAPAAAPEGTDRAAVPSAQVAVPSAQGAGPSARAAAPSAAYAAKDAVAGVAGSSGDGPVEPAAQQAAADRGGRSGVLAAVPAVAAAPAAPPPSATTGLSRASEPEAVRQRASAQRTGTNQESAKAMPAAAMKTACWRVEDPGYVLRLMEAAAPEGGAWRLGNRVIHEEAQPIRWREEIGTAGRRFRIADPDSLAGEGLLLLVRGDSLFQMPAGPDRPVGPLRGVRVACPN